MKTLPALQYLFIVVSLTSPLSVYAQTISNFAAPTLKIGGGDANFADTRSSMFSGWLSVSTNGTISGTITRRNFNSGQTNSGTPPAQLAIVSGSRIFGPVAIDGSITNSWSYEFGSDIRVTTYYSADFYIGTANPSFFVKGRAQHELSSSTNIYTNIFIQPDPEDIHNPIAVTNVYTNISSWTNVSLAGVSFGAVGVSNTPAIRGAFLADEPEY